MQHLLITKEHYHLLRSVFYLINFLAGIIYLLVSVKQINSTTIAVQD